MHGNKDVTFNDLLGTAVKYSNLSDNKFFSSSSGKALYIEPQAKAYLLNLNRYDQHRVRKAIEALSANASPLDGMVSKIRPTLFKGINATSNAFNFIIKYQVTSAVVVVSEIKLNHQLLGDKINDRQEKAALYKVTRDGSGAVSEEATLDHVLNLSKEWKVSGASATTHVATKYAAVNGMLNDLQKAAWLMGVHASHAFAPEKFSQYTLFHNTTKSGMLDLYESVKDNLGLTTDIAKQLSAILEDVQRKGVPVTWIVHSQGGIIFKQALSYHLKRRPGQLLDKNTVAFHSGANNKKITQSLLAKTGVKKVKPDNDNPFDIVPNLAGLNNLNINAITRSVVFMKKVFGIGVENLAESPHTLPYMGLEAYHRFLSLAGDNRSAEKVQQYMVQLNG